MPKGIYKHQKHSKETKQKMSEACLGEKHPMYGKHHSKEAKRKISLANKGYKVLENTKRKISNTLKGHIVSEKTRKKISKGNKGRHWKLSKESKLKISKALIGNKYTLGLKLSKEHKKKISKALKNKYIGKNSSSWKGGLSFEPYGKDWTKQLKRQIRKRDNYICQLCGKEKVNIVHHIDYNKKNCKFDNLINLCKSCHSKINFNRNYWMNYFTCSRN